MTDFVAFLIAGGLMVAGGALVAFETALGRISISRIEELETSGDRAAARMRRVASDRVKYVTVVLFVRQACSVLAIVLIANAFADKFTTSDDWRAVLAPWLIMLVASFIVLGVAPRTLGRQHVEFYARWGAPLAIGLATLLGPVARLLIVLGNAITPGRGYRDGPFATAAELRELVDAAEASELIEDDERRMIHSVFELGETIVREVMVPRTEMVWIEQHKTLRQALSLGLRSGYSRIPVIGEDADDVVGIVYLKDVTKRVYEHRESESSERVDSLMRPVFFVPDSKRADELLKDMQTAHTHIAIVVDEYGGTAGLVSIEDVLEEIVGEITDEYDTAAPEVEELPNGYRISARYHIDDLSKLLDVEIDAEEEGIETVAGLLGKRIGRVPIAGSSIQLDGWKLVAESTPGRRGRVGSFIVTRAQDAAVAVEADE